MPVDNVALYTKNISELSHFFSASNRYQFWLAACLYWLFRHVSYPFWGQRKCYLWRGAEQMFVRFSSIWLLKVEWWSESKCVKDSTVCVRLVRPLKDFNLSGMKRPAFSLFAKFVLLFVCLVVTPTWCSQTILDCGKRHFTHTPTRSLIFYCALYAARNLINFLGKNRGNFDCVQWTID